MCKEPPDVLRDCSPCLSCLYRDPKSVSRVFRLLGRGADLLADKKFYFWNFLKGTGPRRAPMLGKLETGYRKAVLRLNRPTVSSNTTNPSLSRTSSVNSSSSPDPALGRISVSVSRCSDSAHDDSLKRANPKLTSKEQEKLIVIYDVKLFTVVCLVYFDLFCATTSLYCSGGN